MGPASVAIVDRTALWRTTRLVSGDLGSNDPFIALAELMTPVSLQVRRVSPLRGHRNARAISGPM
jgi:hypothetical protein